MFGDLGEHVLTEFLFLSFLHSHLLQAEGVGLIAYLARTNTQLLTTQAQKGGFPDLRAQVSWHAKR